MQEPDHRKRRKTEVFTGFLVLLTTFGFIVAILLDFNFVSPYATLNEDLSFLMDHYNTQRISSYAWLSAAVLTFITIPFYQLTFKGRLKFLHHIATIFILAAGIGFFLSGWLGLKFSDSVNSILANNLSLTEEHVRLQLLGEFHEKQYFKRMAGISLGGLAILLGLTRFWVKRFPLLSSFLLILAGPVLIYYNWNESDHILRTTAIAAIAAGIIVFCIKLICSGLSPGKGKKMASSGQ
ncbi:MAG: hypothetical protein JXR52_12850 [Bacteroidales bacterium]|nr:hypothetical protein [Bacteroidales bacterium]MBN2699707.1 hypothetical protein [Bacteroidales bacterium]